MRLGWLVGALVLTTPRLHAEVDVRVTDNRVSVQAVAAPIAEILEGIARRTGMRLAYDAPLPRQTLSAAFEDRTPAEAVLSVLEGLGLNYALVMDPSGTRVDRLLILGTASASATSSSAAGSGRPIPPPQRPIPQQQEVLNDTEEEEDGGDPDDTMEEMEKVEGQEAGQAAVQPAAPPSILPRAPEYPNSPFSPRLPMPTPPPVPSPQPSPPNPRDQ